VDYRRAAQIAEWTLAALVVGLHLVIFLSPETPGKPQFALAAAHDAQLFSGVVLILAWAVLGPGRWWLRLAVLPVLLILWALPWNTRMIPREQGHLPFLLAGMATLALILARLCGFRMRRLDPATGPERGAQFSLLGLLVVTTLVAAAIGGLEALRPLLGQDRGEDFAALALWMDSIDVGPASVWPIAVRRFVMAIAASLAAVGGLWVVARPGAMWFRLGAVAATVPILAAYLANLSGEASGRTTIAVNLGFGLGLVTIVTGVSVLPLRMFDFRLQRKSVAAKSAQALQAERSRLVTRAGVLSGVTAILIVFLASGPLVRRYESNLQPPATAFAHWISPPPVVWEYRSYSKYWFRLRQIQVQPVEWSQADLSGFEPVIVNEPEPANSAPPPEPEAKEQPEKSP